MLARSSAFLTISMRMICHAALAGSLAITAAVSTAEELPAFRKGMWEFTRTVESSSGKTQTLTTKNCTNPTEDMKKQNEMLGKAGCKFSPVTKSGRAYTFASKCSIQGVAAQSKSVLTVVGDTAYKVNIDSQHGSEHTKELLVAKRIGDC
jgi:hypothetical protein